jgi:hypothetical protein
MRKHLLTLGMLLLLISITGAYNIHQAWNTQSFRCRLEGIRCDACRVGIEEELSEQSGIRSVQFEGEDRKDLLVLHSPSCPADSIRNTLIRIGYDLKNEGRSKYESSSNCACPPTKRRSLFR